MNGAWTSRSRSPRKSRSPKRSSISAPPSRSRILPGTSSTVTSMLAILLSTAGGLLFVPDARGWLHALDVKTGKDLWQGNDGAPHNGGIISYEAGGKQFIAVVTGGASLVSEGYPEQFGGPYKSMEKDTGALIVYTVE